MDDLIAALDTLAKAPVAVPTRSFTLAVREPSVVVSQGAKHWGEITIGDVKVLLVTASQSRSPEER
jgi:hypothetical protein